MLSSLVISSSSNAVKFSSLFRSLGVEVSFLILEPSKNAVFTPLSQHRMYYQGLVHYLNPKDNTVPAHQNNYHQTKKFIQQLESYFLEDLNYKRLAPQNLLNSSSSEPFEIFDRKKVIDLKYVKNLKNIQLEIENKGLISFDHLFVEKTDSCLEFVKEKSSSLVKDSQKSDLIWACYDYRLSGSLAVEDFWFLENQNYLSVFDNCFYLQPRLSELSVWGLIPHHQYLNQQFHQDFQERLRKKIEARFNFVTLSFLKVAEPSLHLMNSQRMQLVQSHHVSGFPCFSFYSEKNVNDWFNQFAKEFNKKHKIKNTEQRA